jgi:hypothetical protein
MRSSRIASGVIASKAKQSRLRDCGGRLVWIASLSLAMTTERDAYPEAACSSGVANLDACARLRRFAAVTRRAAAKRRSRVSGLTATVHAALQIGDEGRAADRPADRLALTQPRHRVAILSGDRMHRRRHPK